MTYIPSDFSKIQESLNIIDSIHDIGELEINPYFEKWGRGRPSKEAKKKREKSFEWERQMDLKYPNRHPLLAAILNGSAIVTPVNNSLLKCVKIIYQQRGINENDCNN